MTAAIEFNAGNIKTAMQNAGAGRSDLWRVPRSALRIKPDFNVRNVHDPEYQAHIRWIADSIRENGFFSDHPLSGFVAREGDEDIIYVTDGHSRLAAVDMLIAEGIEIAELPVVTKMRGTSIEDLTVALYTSNGGRPLTPIETAEVCKRLTGFGWDERRIAQRLGLTPTYVGYLLDLAAAHPEIRQLVQSGKVSATLAMETLRKEGSQARETLRSAVEEAQSEGKAKITRKRLQPKQPDGNAAPAPTENGIVVQAASQAVASDTAAPASTAVAANGARPKDTDLRPLLRDTLAFLRTVPHTDASADLIARIEAHLA